MSAASAAVAGHHAEVFVVAPAGALRHRWYESSTWSEWHTMPLPPRERAAHVGAGAHGRYVDLFVVTTEGQLLHRWWGPGPGWSPWAGWGAGFAGPVTVVSQGAEHNEIWVHRNGVFSHRWLNDHRWSAWNRFV